MTYRLLVLIGMAALAAVCGAQCSVQDHPDCASWAKNGLCTNPSYTKAYLQQYCPITCANSGCGPACPSTAVFISKASECGSTKCPVGSKPVGSVCCVYWKDVLGTAVAKRCPVPFVYMMIPGSAPDGECVNP